MKILKGSKFKLILESEQAQMCENYAGINRQVYNTALAQRNLVYSLYKKSIYYKYQEKELKDLKEAFPYMKLAPSQTIQQSLQDLQTSFDRFFKGISCYPTFRKKFVNDSFRFPTPTAFKVVRISNRKGIISFPKLGGCKFWLNKKLKNHQSVLDGEPKSATVTKEAGVWYVSILVAVEIDDPYIITTKNATSAIALDRGCNNLIGLPIPLLEAPIIPCPKYTHLLRIIDAPEEDDTYNGYLLSLRKDILNKYENKIIKQQKKLAFKKKKSRAYKKVKDKISSLHRKLKNYRQDVLHQLSTWIINNQDIIFLEELDVKKMTKSNKGTLANLGIDVKKKSKLNKSILQQGWGILRCFLKYKAKWFGKLFDDKVSAFYTSQRCYACKHVDSKNRNGDEFHCLRCNHRDHSEVNAAKNILRDGLSRIASKSDKLRLLGLLGTRSLISTI